MKSSRPKCNADWPDRGQRRLRQNRVQARPGISVEAIHTAIADMLDGLEEPRRKDEQATKRDLVLPFLKTLGYDIRNPDEVHPDFATRGQFANANQTSVIDYAIIFDGLPRIYIEVAASDKELDDVDSKLGQMFESCGSVRLAILTNGLEYRFYTDVEAEGFFDDEPFFVVRLDEVDDGLDVLPAFHVEQFSADAVRDFAEDVLYTRRIVDSLRRRLVVGPEWVSNDFVWWAIRSPSIFEGDLTLELLERLRPLARIALEHVIRQLVRQELAAQRGSTPVCERKDLASLIIGYRRCRAQLHKIVGQIKAYLQYD